MSKATRDNTKERKPRPKQRGMLVGVRLQPPDLGSLDAWIAKQNDPELSRPEALRRLAAIALAKPKRKR
jgi:hypothetical protein